MSHDLNQFGQDKAEITANFCIYSTLFWDHTIGDVLHVSPPCSRTLSPASGNDFWPEEKIKCPAVIWWNGERRRSKRARSAIAIL